MDTIINTTITEQLNILYKMLDSQTRKLAQLDKYKNTRLVASYRKNGKVQLYKIEKGSKTRKYISIKSKEADCIREAKYLKISISRIKKNIELLERVKGEYKAVDNATIKEMLPSVYATAIINPNTESLTSKAAKWKADKEAFKEEFNKVYPDKYADDKRIQAADGQWVRSKAEAQIIDQLIAHNLVYVYELPHYCDGRWIRSDFTILSPIDRETEIILEHAGLMGDPKYQQKHFSNQIYYMQEGYKPNINLFTSYDYLDGTFSVMPLNWIIKQIESSVPPKQFLTRKNPDDAKTLALEIEARSKSPFRQ